MERGNPSDLCKHEKSSVWFLNHYFQDSEGSSKLVGFFTPKNVSNIPSTTLLKVNFDSHGKLVKLGHQKHLARFEFGTAYYLIETVLLRLPHRLTMTARLRPPYQKCQSSLRYPH